MEKCGECVMCIFGCMLIQMQHPIQMKPADSEKRGKYFHCMMCMFVFLMLLCTDM